MATTTLFHGDCLEVMATLPDNSVDLVLADPPYGTTRCKWDAVIPFKPMWEQLHRVAKERAAIVITASQPFTSALVMSNQRHFRYCWVWEKSKPVGHLNAKRRPLTQHEDVAVFCRRGAPYIPQGLISGNFKNTRPKKAKGEGGEQYGKQRGNYENARFTNYPTSVLKFSTANKTKHPTEKPVDLMAYMIRTYTNPGDVVLDFTMGSGTTGVACKQEGRSFIGIELDDEYFEIAERRIAEVML